MESSIFTYMDGWDTMASRVFTFDHVRLIVDVGEYKAGTRFVSAKIDYGKSPSVSFYGKYGQEVAKFALSLKVGDAISA